MQNEQLNEQLSLCIEETQDVDDDLSEETPSFADDTDSDWELFGNNLFTHLSFHGFTLDPRNHLPKVGFTDSPFSPPELI